MPSNSISLRYSRNLPKLHLREICGADELKITDTSTGCAIDLLDRILDFQHLESTNSLSAHHIVTADRDLILAQVYKSLYGDTIESTVACRYCESRFDMNFSLDGLQRHLFENRRVGDVIQAEDGTFRIDSTCCFRLPIGEDELAVVGHSPDDAAKFLLKRCLLEGDPEQYGDKVQQAMSEIAPVIQTNMKALCPECGKEQELFFDMQSFLLGRLMNEQKQTIKEIHRLASVYHWNNTEILSLTRKLRRMYFNQIESER